MAENTTLFAAHCYSCDWHGYTDNLDDACYSCGEYESLLVVTDDDRQVTENIYGELPPPTMMDF